MIIGLLALFVNVPCNYVLIYGKLGFPATLIGTRVRIPRLGFLHWMQYGNGRKDA